MDLITPIPLIMEFMCQPLFGCRSQGLCKIIKLSVNLQSRTYKASECYLLSIELSQTVFKERIRRVGGGVRGVRTNPLWWSIMED